MYDKTLVVDTLEQIYASSTVIVSKAVLLMFKRMWSGNNYDFLRIFPTACCNTHYLNP